MGQRGGTRPGECVKKSRIQETPERFVNVGGVNVPVTNNVHTSWSTTTSPAPVKVKAGAPYAGLARAAKVPTNVVHEFKG